MADVGSEEQIRQDEKIALEKLIMDQGISRDAGSSYSGLYELCGDYMLVTCKFMTVANEALSSAARHRLAQRGFS